MTDSDPKSQDVFNVERIRQLVELMKEFDLTEIDLEQDENGIRLRRGGEAPLPVPMPTPIMPPAIPAAPVAVPVAGSPAPASAPAPAAEEKNIAFIKSPMVGTFYCKPNPEAQPFVKVGDNVGPETIVCIVEAMKVFNEIPADISGKIVAVLVDNEEPVEFGKPLFKVDTSK